MIGNCVYLLILYPIFKIINGTTTIYTTFYHSHHYRNCRHHSPCFTRITASFAGILLYKFFGNPEFSIIYVIIFGILTLASLILNYTIPIKTTAKYGGSRYGKIGGFLGTIIGLFFPPIGFIIGMLLGVF
jgi:hypothetical protein